MRHKIYSLSPNYNQSKIELRHVVFKRDEEKSSDQTLMKVDVGKFNLITNRSQMKSIKPLVYKNSSYDFYENLKMLKPNSVASKNEIINSSKREIFEMKPIGLHIKSFKT